MDLNNIRKNIDSIDDKILGLFLERMKLCGDVAEYKRANNMPVFQGKRETEILNRIKSLTGDTSLENGTCALFSSIIEISKILQNRQLLSESPEIKYDIPDFENAAKIGCQGTSGANSETASRMIFGDSVKPVFFRSFEDVFKAVQNGDVQYGVLPVVNSTAGSVISTYDLMSKYDVYIVKEVDVEINHCLCTRENVPMDSIEKVYSHPQALAQCSSFLSENNLRTSEYGNTATSAEKVLNSPDRCIGAICSVECARQLGLEIVAQNIADCAVNRTRFICISRSMQVSPDADAVSVMLKIPHTEGSLYKLLTKFYVNGMNLIKIESRPIKDGSFEVLFFLDFSGKLSDPSVHALINDLQKNLEFFKILGTY